MKQVRHLGLPGLLVGIACLHVAAVVFRLPRVAFVKRAEAIERYRELGAIRFHLGEHYTQAAEVLAWLRQNTPEDSVILYRGEQKGVLEFAPALLYPRLIYHAAGVAKGADLGGRRIARGRYAEQPEGELVLVGQGGGLVVETR